MEWWRDVRRDCPDGKHNTCQEGDFFYQFSLRCLANLFDDNFPYSSQSRGKNWCHKEEFFVEWRKGVERFSFSWMEDCNPIKKAGWFRHLRKHNKSLLMKWLWRFPKEEQNIVGEGDPSKIWEGKVSGRPKKFSLLIASVCGGQSKLGVCFL